jgi:hypothetical protein
VFALVSQKTLASLDASVPPPEPELEADPDEEPELDAEPEEDADPDEEPPAPEDEADPDDEPEPDDPPPDDPAPEEPEEPEGPPSLLPDELLNVQPAPPTSDAAHAIATAPENATRVFVDRMKGSSFESVTVGRSTPHSRGRAAARLCL